MSVAEMLEALDAATMLIAGLLMLYKMFKYAGKEDLCMTIAYGVMVLVYTLIYWR